MTQARQIAFPPRAARALALTGVVLVALNLRTSVASMSPIYDLISQDVPLSVPIIAAIGVFPPAAFAVSGLLAPRVESHIGLEGSLTAALLVATAGHLLRALAGGPATLVAGTAINLFGLGVGNVLLPPIVKRYFPEHQGSVTSLYAALIAISTAIPPLLAVPVAKGSDWRVSLGMWALLSLVAMLPWLRLVQLGRATRATRCVVAAEEKAAPGASAGSRVRVWRMPITWALAAVFSVSAMNGYAMFAWLPSLLVDTAGVSARAAGSLLSLYAIIGLPLAVTIPALTERVKNPLWIMLVGLAATVVGNVGLLLAPATATWVWVAVAGLGPLLFPVCLTLINLRSRTDRGSAALSGASQGVGYVLGALGPVAFGLLHDVTGGWTAPMLFLTLIAVPGLGAAVLAVRCDVVEDHLRPPRPAARSRALPRIAPPSTDDRRGANT